ncbi:MAG: hypothetical protein K2X47_11755 [Bdellovibrionales bacterium]|nr:hypothetical protein [Bdellovibrionales bacterium]
MTWSSQKLNWPGLIGNLLGVSRSGLPIVVKRTKALTGQPELGQGEYKYYGVVTNLPLLDWSPSGSD